MSSDTKYNLGDILNWKEDSKVMEGEVACIKIVVSKEQIQPVYAMRKLKGDNKFYWIEEDKLSPVKENQDMVDNSENLQPEA